MKLKLEIEISKGKAGKKRYDNIPRGAVTAQEPPVVNMVQNPFADHLPSVLEPRGSHETDPFVERDKK